MFVDFYAPWCGHCKRLSPELDKAAPVLAELEKPIVIAKVDADKYTRLATKYKVDGFPTLMVFLHGVPTEYHGPRKVDLLVRSLIKFVAPDVSILASDTDVSDFLEAAATEFPIFIGFGLNETVISNLAIKHKKRAWFSVAKDFSEDAMVLYDFDKVPALVALYPKYDEKSIFYGPFEDKFLQEFIKQNLLPLVMPLNQETLRLLKDDNRKIVVTIVEDDKNDKAKDFVKLLKAAASANRDLVFGYVGFGLWEEFAQSFEVTKHTKLPKMVVWDGNEDYFSVIGSDSIEEGDQGSQITRFLEGYREGSVIQKQLSGPSFMGFLRSLLGVRTIYIVVFLVAVAMLIRSIGSEEPLRVGTREQADREESSIFQDESREAMLKKED